MILFFWFGFFFFFFFSILGFLIFRTAKERPIRPGLSNCVNSVTGQRTCAFLGTECDNNNDFDVASVKALDNKRCSEACLPGEWQSAEHELGGRRSPARTPARTPRHPSPALPLLQEGMVCAKMLEASC